MATHPVLQAIYDSAASFQHAIDDMVDDVDRIRARRPSPHGLVIPELDACGRLTDLYITPGTIDRFDDNRELAGEILAAVQDSTADAIRQEALVIDEASSRLNSAPGVTSAIQSGPGEVGS